MFDGVHLGHQKLIGHVVDAAHAGGMASFVVTFDPHPATILGRAPMQQLTDMHEKATLISRLGVENLVVLPFTRDTANTAAEDFATALAHALRLHQLWIGPDFVLGRNRQGNAAFLAEAGKALGFTVSVMPPLMVGGERVSSSRLRAARDAGDTALVRALLNR
jgi:riboflavin kinase/FMN adenylyltransferase